MTSAVHATLFQCESADGSITFQGFPCPEIEKALEVGLSVIDGIQIWAPPL